MLTGARRRALLLPLVLLGATACAAGPDDQVLGPPPSPSPTSGPDDETLPPGTATITEPTPAEALRVPLDSQGRPYDAPVHQPATTQTRAVGTLDVVDGQLQVMDGIALVSQPVDDGVLVEVDGDERLAVDVVWQVYEGFEAVLGVRVSRPGRPAVARWERFEPAYGTDGGLGGITSTAVVRRARATAPQDWPQVDLRTVQDVRLLDLDGRPGDDSLVFTNGFGDGGFPLSRGVDASGRLVAVLVWDQRYPWRLAVPEGTPPPDVTEREEEIADCIAGRRPIAVYGDDDLECS